MILGLSYADWAVLVVYFVVVAYLGIVVGGKKTHSLGDFYIAGGNWGAIASFIFIFSSSLAGNEAVVVGGEAYRTGLSGVWYWWSFLIVTPVYYLYSTVYKRARVYNASEFFEMRYNKAGASFYALLAGIVTILLCGTFLLAVTKVIAGITSLDQNLAVWIVALIVGGYVYAGGMMSAMLTDLVQGVMIILFFIFALLPILYHAVGGFEAIKAYSEQNPQIWNLFGDGSLDTSTIIALNLSALVGGIAFPGIFNWIAVSKNERVATQCGWAHLFKRIITIFFALFGIMFAMLKPGLTDPEASWGSVMSDIMPSGLKGLLIATFFAAAMSSADTNATTSSSMFIDYFYRRVLRPGKPMLHYLGLSKFWAMFSVLVAALLTIVFTDVFIFVKLFMALLSFLGIPILFGTFTRKANVGGMWLSLLMGFTAFLTVVLVFYSKSGFLSFSDAINSSFTMSVYTSVSAAVVGMLVGMFWFKPSDKLQIDRFFYIIQTPIGHEQKLLDAGIVLPSLIDAKLATEGTEKLKSEVISARIEELKAEKVFGAKSIFELYKEKTAKWYYPGLLKITLGCIALVVGTIAFAQFMAR